MFCHCAFLTAHVVLTHARADVQQPNGVAISKYVLLFKEIHSRGTESGHTLNCLYALAKSPPQSHSLEPIVISLSVRVETDGREKWNRVPK